MPRCGCLNSRPRGCLLGIAMRRGSPSTSTARSAFMFLGRGIHFAVAREGALKLKETAYRQAKPTLRAKFDTARKPW